MKTPLDISTTYLGLKLRSPLVPSASPLSEHLDGLMEMERSGAGAVVLHSLFDEPYDKSHGHPDHYFKEIVAAKENLTIPVIASLNATSLDRWAKLAAQIETAGADALELNIYNLSLDPDVSAAEVEKTYLDVVRAVTRAVKIPVSVKLPPFFTNLAHMTKAFDEAGAKGLVLFNRFYQPDLDLTTMGPGYTLRLSKSPEMRFPMRWISLLYRQARIDLAASTGIRTGDDVLKMVLSGASATQLCSILLGCGIGWLETIEQELRDCMIEYNVPSLSQARGQLSHLVKVDPGEIEREEYRRALQGYSLIDVPSWKDEVWHPVAVN